jgi:hypothetical protein
MAPRELLGVFVRIVGLGLILLAVFDLVYFVMKIFGMPTTSLVPASVDAWAAAFYSVLGFLVLAGVKKIVRFAYWIDD